MMIKAVLLDLDDTLLMDPQRQLVQAYKEKATQYFFAHHKWEGIHTHLIGSIREMASSDSYEATNVDVATAYIAQQVNTSQEALKKAFEPFYAQIYPAFKALLQPHPCTVSLVQFLLHTDMDVIIATNPVYPANAIYQRLSWTGLDPYLADFAFITTGDNTHFIKPDPRYYAEILGQVGIEPDEAVMVGNDVKNDILPAQQVGMHTYHITPQPEDTPAEAAGTLEDFYRVCQQGEWFHTLTINSLHPEMIIPELEGNLGALFGMLAMVKPHYWTQHPDPDEWSILEIVYHLYSRERGLMRPRLQRILAENNPFLSVPPPDDPERHVKGRDGMTVARDFVRERQQTIQLLQSLSPDDWYRRARHSIFSNTTLLEMAHFTAQHDRLHLTQICQTLGKCD